MAESKAVGATWLASVPKSGNTMLRLLLEAYWRNGMLDINDVRFCTADSDPTLLRAVSTLPLEALGFHGQMLVRPAALINHLALREAPIFVKTHFANVRPDGDLPACIPKTLTNRAVYIVRDPRSVALSIASFYGFSMEKTMEVMSNPCFRLGDDKGLGSVLVSDWSNHVRSWVGEDAFPVHVVRYEDMVDDTALKLAEILEFLEEPVDLGRVQLAVEAVEMSKLQKIESEEGFRENVGRGSFFNGGGTRWEQELGPKFIRMIEDEHGEVMRMLGYLETEGLSVVKEVTQ